MVDERNSTYTAFVSAGLQCGVQSGVPVRKTRKAQCCGVCGWTIYGDVPRKLFYSRRKPGAKGDQKSKCDCPPNWYKAEVKKKRGNAGTKKQSPKK